MQGWGRWPAAAVETVEGSLEDFEHEFDIRRGAIDHGEGVEAECGGHVADGIPRGTRALDDHGRGWAFEATEQVEDAGTGLVIAFHRADPQIEWEAEIDYGDVDDVCANDALGLAGGLGPQGLNAHGLQKAGHAVGPGIGPPAAPGEEEVQAAAGRGGVGAAAAAPATIGVMVVLERGIGAVKEHLREWMGKRDAGLEGWNALAGVGIRQEIKGRTLPRAGGMWMRVSTWQVDRRGRNLIEQNPVVRERAGTLPGWIRR